MNQTCIIQEKVLPHRYNNNVRYILTCESFGFLINWPDYKEADTFLGVPPFISHPYFSWTINHLVQFYSTLSWVCTLRKEGHIIMNRQMNANLPGDQLALSACNA